MYYWIYDYSPLVSGSVFVIGFIFTTFLLVYLFRRFLRPTLHKNKQNNEMVSLMLSSFLGLYGLLLGLLAVAAYQNLTDVTAVVSDEASSLGAFYSDVQAYPEPTKGLLQNQLRDYTRFTIDRAWPEQQKGLILSEGTHRIMRLAKDLTDFAPSSKREEILHAEAYRQFNQYQEHRSSRLGNVSTQIPAIFWAVVLIGSVITITLLALFDIEIFAHFCLSGLTSGFLGLVIFLVAAMDNPFRGSVSVSSAPFEDVYQSIMLPEDSILRSMSILLSETQKYGHASIEGDEFIDGKKVPILLFGKTRMNGFSNIVDDTTENSGLVATLFVKSDDNFIRVTTNVRKDDGSRAVGTMLDIKSPALKNIREGKPYYGDAPILNKTYVTGYEPIKNDKSEIVGIFFVGFLKPEPDKQKID
jgi:hypothetical protein